MAVCLERNRLLRKACPKYSTHTNLPNRPSSSSRYRSTASAEHSTAVVVAAGSILLEGTHSHPEEEDHRSLAEGSRRSPADGGHHLRNLFGRIGVDPGAGNRLTWRQRAHRSLAVVYCQTSLEEGQWEGCRTWWEEVGRIGKVDLINTKKLTGPALVCRSETFTKGPTQAIKWGFLWVKFCSR